MAAIRRSLSSCLEATRIWRRTDRASLEKKPSTRLSQEPCLGTKVNSKRRRAARRARLGSPWRCARNGCRESSGSPDGHRLVRLVLGRGRLHHLYLAVDAQHLGHFFRKLRIAALQVVAHLVRLYFLLVEDLAQRALRQLAQAPVSRFGFKGNGPLPA